MGLDLGDGDPDRLEGASGEHTRRGESVKGKGDIFYNNISGKQESISMTYNYNRSYSL
jgi:hypothetical protein